VPRLASLLYDAARGGPTATKRQAPPIRARLGSGNRSGDNPGRSYPYTFFYDQCSILGAKEISKAVAPPHCKFFIWLAIMDRCWTSARLQRHQLQNSGPCVLCSQAEESIDHLVISLCVQQGSLAWCVSHGGYHLTPMGAQSIVDWWLPTRKRVHKSNRKGFDTQFAVVVWSLWLERNARVFNAKASMVRQLCVAVRDEGRQWKLASYRDLEEFIH
jgi:hypothetical protein